MSPSIGSADWDNELREAGVSRAAVEILVAEALGGRAPEEMTVEAIDVAYVEARELWEKEEGGGPFRAALREAGMEGELSASTELVVTAAAELLLDQRCPRPDGYWFLAGYSLSGRRLEERRVARWYARQLATLLTEGAEERRQWVREDFQYGSWFAKQEIAEALFTELLTALPAELHLWLVSMARAVRWELKRAVAERLMPVVFSGRAAPEIESEPWAEELALVGVAKEEVMALYEDVFAGKEAGTVYNLDLFHAHWVMDGELEKLLARRGDGAELFDEDSPARRALQSAALFVAFSRRPLHESLDYMRVCGWALNEPEKPYTPRLRRWMSRQIAACLAQGWERGEGERASSWVEHVQDQFFGFTDLDPVLFPWLVVDLPELHADLLAGSATVAWAGKREFYAQLAGDAAMHAAVAEALVQSCKSGVFHSIDAREGLELLSRLETLGAERREEIRAFLTEPVEAVVVAVAAPGESRYRTEHAGRCFVAFDFASEWPMWLMDAELWSGEVRVGALASWYHGMWPEGPTTGRAGLQRDGASQPVPVERRRDMEVAAGKGEANGAGPGDATKKIAWHAMDVAYERAAELVGQRVQFRPRLG